MENGWMILKRKANLLKLYTSPFFQDVYCSNFTDTESRKWTRTCKCKVSRNNIFVQKSWVQIISEKNLPKFIFILSHMLLHNNSSSGQKVYWIQCSIALFNFICMKTMKRRKLFGLLVNALLLTQNSSTFFVKGYTPFTICNEIIEHTALAVVHSILQRMSVWSWLVWLSIVTGKIMFSTASQLEEEEDLVNICLCKLQDGLKVKPAEATEALKQYSKFKAEIDRLHMRLDRPPVSAYSYGYKTEVRFQHYPQYVNQSCVFSFTMRSSLPKQPQIFLFFNDKLVAVLLLNNYGIISNDVLSYFKRQYWDKYGTVISDWYAS